MKKKKNAQERTEREEFLSAVEYLTRQYQNDSRFIKVEPWRECGEYGFWLCLSELIPNVPEEFMGFEVDIKIIGDQDL